MLEEHPEDDIMKIKAVFNETDARQAKYIKFLKRTFPETIDEENPDMYYVIGGDGAMLHAHKNMVIHKNLSLVKGLVLLTLL